MHLIYLSVLVPISLIIAAALGGCSDDALISSGEGEGAQSSSTAEGNVTIIPEAKIEIPGPEWMGTLTEYAALFEEDRFAKDGLATDFPRLFIRASKVAYTGSITRLYQNGAVEFMGRYDDGYLEGLAQQWARDGSLISKIRAKRGQVQDEEIADPATSAAPVLNAQAGAGDEDSVVPEEPIFVGSNEDLAEWTTVSGEDDYLIDKRTGKKVTGGIKVYDGKGKLSYFSQYKGGKLHGRSENVHANGQKMTQAQYANGIKHGVEIWWDEKGYKTYEANFANGKLSGLVTLYGDEGQVSSQLRYLDGEVVEEVFVAPQP